MNKILINLSNLHVGGGVQVATSFVNELSKILSERKCNNKVYLYLSDSVKINLEENLELSMFELVLIKNTFGVSFKKDNDFIGYDVIFTLFGPFYYKHDAKFLVTGFAQAWIAYPNNLAFQKLSFLNKIKSSISYLIKEMFFKKSSLLIVEAKHVKDALIKKGYDGNDIIVIDNTVSSIYYDDNWLEIDYIKRDFFTLGFIGRNYSHKNLKILCDVNHILIHKYGIKCDFLFTLTNEEMIENSFISLDNFYSVGPLAVQKCPSFYQQIDALIFPSLLECFSATPIEAMKMGKLVIASNLPFVTDVCKSSARYFDPISPESIAAAIYAAISEPDENLKLITEAKLLVENLPTAKDRALAYLDILSNLK